VSRLVLTGAHRPLLVDLAAQAQREVGLLLLPGQPRSRSDKIKLSLDALVVGASTFMVLWYLVLGPIFATDGVTITEVAYSAALPVLALPPTPIPTASGPTHSPPNSERRPKARGSSSTRNLAMRSG